LKIVILILSSNTYPSKRNGDIIRATWGKGNTNLTQIYFYRSDVKTELNQNILSIRDNGTAQDIGHKTLKAFEWVSNNVEFDYIFRTNTSSYVNVSNLEKYIQEEASEESLLYRGILHERKYKSKTSNFAYVNGAGVLMNKKVIDLVLSKKEQWDHSEWDDVALGKLMFENGVTPSVGKRYTVVNNFYSNNIHRENYHVRCRLDQDSRYPRYLETIVLKDVYNHFEKRKNIESHSSKKFIFYIAKFFYIDKPGWKLYNLFFRLLKTALPKSLYDKLRKFKSQKIYGYVLKYYQKEAKEE
jgi:hypothetical protein